MAVALFEAPDLALLAAEVPFGDEVPLQDLAIFSGALLGNRAAAGAFWGLLRERWTPFQARLADAPLMLRRVVEGIGSLTTRQQLEEARAFFAAHDVPAARQGIAQTLERLGQDVALWERIAPAVGRVAGGSERGALTERRRRRGSNSGPPRLCLRLRGAASVL